MRYKQLPECFAEDMGSATNQKPTNPRTTGLRDTMRLPLIQRTMVRPPCDVRYRPSELKMQERSVCLSAFRETVSLTKSDCRLAQVGSRVAAGTPYGKLPEGPEPSGGSAGRNYPMALAIPLRRTVELVESDSTVSTIPPSVPRPLSRPRMLAYPYK